MAFGNCEIITDVGKGTMEMSLWTSILYKLHNQLERERTNYSVSCQLEIVNSQHILEQCDTNQKKNRKTAGHSDEKRLKEFYLLIT